jgi:hypothetical protein
MEANGRKLESGKRNGQGIYFPSFLPASLPYGI